MKKIIITGLAVIFTLLTGKAGMAQDREEFNGPFDSWANVRKRFHARGDGKSDDTRAIQSALDSLTNTATGFNTGKEGYTVLYLPAGTYCISSTLLLKGKVGISIIGEDPLKTVIRWTGGDKDTMLWANGSAYYKITRLTWDAGKAKDMEGIGIHWKDRWNNGVSRSFASLNIEISDNIFTGGFKFGISGGTSGEGTGFNDSEITIRRCTFRNCYAGVEIHGYNALDYWIWDCRFLGGSMGIECSYGNYHAYHCFFSGLSVCDLHHIHGYYNSARECYSENSRGFSMDESFSSNPFKRIFENNKIINPGILPIVYGHTGKITLWGNQFTKTRDTANKSIVYYRSWASVNYEVLSLHNSYPYKNPINIAAKPSTLYSFGDDFKTIVKPSAAAFQAEMDRTPVRVSRKIFEVPPGAATAAIQTILDQAAGMKGQRPVVHFGMGLYYIDKTLVIPAGADIQIYGDGLLYATRILKKEGVGLQGALIQVKGPSYITIQDLQIGKDGDRGLTGVIRFEDVDQPGSQVHLDQIYSHADTSLSVRAMNYLYLQKDNSFFTDGNYVSGGSLLKNGGGTARVCCFGGQFANVRVEENGRFISKDCWWEGENRLPINLEGAGKVCIDGAMVAPNHADSMPVIRIGKFKGDISLMNMYVQGALAPQGDNPDLNLFVWNIHFYRKMDVLGFLRKDVSYKGAFLGLNVQCFNPADTACKFIKSVNDEFRNVKDVNATLEAGTAFDRSSTPIPFRNLANAVSNIRISRVSLPGREKNGLIFTAQ